MNPRSLPLEEFRRDVDAARARLHASGEAEILTVDGEPDLVVQDAAKYEAMLEELEERRFVQSVLSASERMRSGADVGISLDDLEAELRQHYDL